MHNIGEGKISCRPPLLVGDSNNSKEVYFMVVYVLNKNNKPLMPCKPQRARKLIKEKKAKIVN